MGLDPSETFGRWPHLLNRLNSSFFPYLKVSLILRLVIIICYGSSSDYHRVEAWKNTYPSDVILVSVLIWKRSAYWDSLASQFLILSFSSPTSSSSSSSSLLSFRLWLCDAKLARVRWTLRIRSACFFDFHCLDIETTIK